MCLAIPAKVLEHDGREAVVDILGVKRKADLSLLEDVAVGDYVLLHAGFGIEKLDEEAALETIELHRQIAAIELEAEESPPRS